MDNVTVPVVAVVNTSVEVIELLTDVFEWQGWEVVSAYVVDFKRGHQDIRAFLAEHRPGAIVFDIAPPYAENWRYFQTVCELPEVTRDLFIVTTTNKQRLEAIAGPSASFEFVGKPFDLAQIVAAVGKVLRDHQ